MAQTFVFEELDSTTRDYLTAVRDGDGYGAPGVFVPSSSSMASCGCISGVVIVAFTLIATLTTWPADLVYQDPGAVALLQTAGLLTGGWLLVAALRTPGAKGNKSQAGHWVYADSLFLYEAYREQVKITAIDEIEEANVTHNYNEGKYQNSVLRLDAGESGKFAVTLYNEDRAGQLTVFLNYLAWARGAGAAGRASLTPAQLGAVARYVSEHDVEPKNHADEIDLDLVSLELDAMPEEHSREGSAAPALIPYVLIAVAAVGIFVVMWKFVNPPIRDDAIFDAVKTPTVMPIVLREYLIDARNTRHRDEVIKLLPPFYRPALNFVEQNGQNDELKKGLLAILESVKDAEQPLVSLKVTEKAPANTQGGAARVKTLRDDLVGGVDQPKGGFAMNKGGILGELAKGPGLGAVPPPPDTTFTDKPPPYAVQLLTFADMPEEAPHAHFEVTYEFRPTDEVQLYELVVKVEIRTKLDAAPVAVYEEHVNQTFGENQFNQQIVQLKDRLVKGFVGQGAVNNFPQPPVFPPRFIP